MERSAAIADSDAWRCHTDGNAAYQRGDLDAAAGLLERSRVLFEEIGERGGVAWSCNNLGKVAYRRGDYGAAREYAETSLRMFQAAGDHNGIAWSLHILGRISYREGNYTQARTHYQESAALFHAIPSHEALRMTLEKLGKTLFRLGDLDGAFQTYSEALEMNRDARDDSGIQVCVDSLLHIAYKQDKPWLTDLFLSASRTGYIAGAPAVATDATASKQRSVWNQCLITLWKEMF